MLPLSRSQDRFRSTPVKRLLKSATLICCCIICIICRPAVPPPLNRPYRPSEDVSVEPITLEDSASAGRTQRYMNIMEVFREAFGIRGDMEGVNMCDRFIRSKKFSFINNVAHVFVDTKDIELYDGNYEKDEMKWGWIEIPTCCWYLAWDSSRYRSRLQQRLLRKEGKKKAKHHRQCYQQIIISHLSGLLTRKRPDAYKLRLEIEEDGSCRKGENKETRCSRRRLLPHEIIKGNGTICHICHKALRLMSKRDTRPLRVRYTDPTGQEHTFLRGRCKCGLNDEDQYSEMMRESGGGVPDATMDKAGGNEYTGPSSSQGAAGGGSLDDANWLLSSSSVMEEFVTIENAYIGAKVLRSSQWREQDGDDDGGAGNAGVITGITHRDGRVVGEDANRICDEQDWRECCVVKWERTGRIDGYPIGDHGEYVLRFDEAARRADKGEQRPVEAEDDEENAKS